MIERMIGVLSLLILFLPFPLFAASHKTSPTLAPTVTFSPTASPTPQLKAPCQFLDGWNGFYDQGGYESGLILANRFTTNGPQTVNTIWVNVFPGGSPYIYMKAAIYTDANNAPACLVVSTNGQTAVDHYNALSITPTSVNGTYWVLYQINAPYFGWSEGVSNVVSGSFSNEPYSPSFPTTLTGFKLAPTGRAWDFFADYCERGNTVTPTYSPTDTPLPTNTPTPGTIPSTGKPPIFKKGMILAFGGSTTEMLGQYIDILRPSIYATYGYGGPGLRMFKNASVENDQINVSGGLKNIFRQDVWTSMPENYSIDGEGFWAANGSDDWLNYTVENQAVTFASKSALIYLQQPGGGIFVAGYAPVTNGTPYDPVTVKCSGKLSVKAVQLHLNKKDTVLCVQHVKGNVCLYGFYAINDSGATLSKVAGSGNSLGRFASLDPEALREWMDLLPHVTGCLINLGMNDRFDATGPIFYQKMDHFSSMLTAAHPSDIKIVLINSNQPIDYYSGNMSAFSTQLENLATAKNYDFFNIADPAVLGGYIEAANHAWTLDGLHPNKDGNEQICKMLRSYLGLK